MASRASPLSRRDQLRLKEEEEEEEESTARRRLEAEAQQKVTQERMKGAETVPFAAKPKRGNRMTVRWRRTEGRFGIIRPRGH